MSPRAELSGAGLRSSDAEMISPEDKPRGPDEDRNKPEEDGVSNQARMGSCCSVTDSSMSSRSEVSMVFSPFLVKAGDDIVDVSTSSSASGGVGQSGISERRGQYVDPLNSTFASGSVLSPWGFGWGSLGSWVSQPWGPMRGVNMFVDDLARRNGQRREEETQRLQDPAVMAESEAVEEITEEERMRREERNMGDRRFDYNYRDIPMFGDTEVAEEVIARDDIFDISQVD